MTKDEITAIARRLFPLLPHPTKPYEPWWTPGRMCDGRVSGTVAKGIYECDKCTYRTRPDRWQRIKTDHEIPPPDPMDWEVFGQLLMFLDTIGIWYEPLRSPAWTACVQNKHAASADDPRSALLLAVAKMKEVAE